MKFWDSIPGRERSNDRSLEHKSTNWLRRNRDLFKAYLIFLFVTALGFTIVALDWTSGYIIDNVNNATAAMSGWLISLLGTNVTVSASVLMSPAGSVSIGEGCNSIYATILFLGGVFAFPTTWRKKLLGAILGSVALFLINLIRVVTLFYLSGYSKSLFDEAHLHVWQFIIILIGGLLWLLWYDKIVNRRSRAKAL